MITLSQRLLLSALCFFSSLSQATVLIYTDHSQWLADAATISTKDMYNTGHSHSDSMDSIYSNIVSIGYTGAPGISGYYDGGLYAPLSPGDDKFFLGDLELLTNTIDFSFFDLDHDVFAFGGQWNASAAGALFLSVNGEDISIKSSLVGGSGFFGIITTSSPNLSAQVWGDGLFAVDNMEIYVAAYGDSISEQDLSAIPIPGAAWLLGSALAALVSIKRRH